jgi:hypothetical protein
MPRKIKRRGIMGSEIVTVYQCKDYSVFYQDQPYHKYWRAFPDGREEKIPSVTKITGQLDKPALLGWAAGLTAEYIISKIPDIKTGKLILTPADAKKLFYEAKAEANRVKTEAADYGTLIHQTVEDWIKYKYMGIGTLPKAETPEAKKSLDGFKRLCEVLKLTRVLASEKILYSPEYNYGGTIDLVVEANGVIEIWDLKTSSGFYPEMIMQFSSYRELWNENFEEQATGIRGIRLDKKTFLPYQKEFTEYQDVCFQKFLCLLQYCELDNAVKIE